MLRNIFSRILTLIHHRSFFFLFLLFLPTQLGFHFWPGFSRVLGRRIDYLSPTIFFTDVLIFLALGFWLVEKIVNKNVPRRFFLKKRILISGTLITFLFLNIFFAQTQTIAFFKTLKIIELFLLGIYIVDTKPKLSILTTPLSLAVIFISVLAFAQFFLQHSVGGLLWFVGERSFASYTPGIAQASLGGRLLLRPYATFPHPNVLAGFVVLLFPLFTSVQTKAKQKKSLVLFAMLASILVLPVTMSRAAWLVFIFVLISAVFILLRKKTRYRQTVVKIILGSTLLVTLFLSQLVVFRIQELWQQGNNSFVQRQKLTNTAVVMISDKPIFGVGLNNFIPAIPHYTSLQSINFQLQPAHSLYILLISETGVIGFVLFLFLVAASLLQTLRKKHWFLFLSIIALLLLGFFDHYLFTLQQTQILVTILFALTFV